MERSISLHSSANGSSKVYNVFLQKADGGYIVRYQNGRLGSTLTGGDKTHAPVPLEKADAIFDKLVREKMTGSSKYQPLEGAVPVAAQAAIDAQIASGFEPMLLNSITREEAELLISDDQWAMQIKYDGERRPVIFEPGKPARGVNKKGNEVPLLTTLAHCFTSWPGSVILDAEQIGEKLFVFDVIERNGRNLASLPFEVRVANLEEFAKLMPGVADDLIFVATAFSADNKRALFRRVQAQGGEGVVFKRKTAAYQPGRPSSTLRSDALKYKFTDSLTAEVIGHSNGVKSIEIGVYNDQGMLNSLKNVTVPVSMPMPALGAFVEVRYLYAWPTGGLAQPVLLSVRNDVDKTDCSQSQLRFKPD